MKKKGYFLYLILLILSLQSYAQDSFYIIGRIKDRQTNTVIATTHIVNLKNKRGAISNQQGYFMIQVSENDYLKFSHLSYNNLYFQVKSKTSDTLEIFLNKKTYVLKEVEVFPWTKQEFKYQFVHKKIKKDSVTWLKDRINVSTEELIWLTPAGMTINYKTSKERQEIALRALKKWLARDDEFRKIAANITEYKNGELEAFVRYCNFSKQYISEAREYYLTLAIHKKYLTFEQLKNKSIKNDK